MNKSSTGSGSDHINFKLQKTIANLISNVISSLCQQFIRYEHSVDIFGLLSINIDDDAEISVKLNEKFIKKDMINNTSTNFDCSKLIETIKKNGDQKESVELHQVVSKEDDKNKMETEGLEKECSLIGDENEKDSSTQKRRPRKPQQTFRHVAEDDAQFDKENQKIQNTLSDGESKELQIDSQYEFETIDDEKDEDYIDVVDYEMVNKSNEMDDYKDLKLSIDQNESRPCKPNAIFKCSICDRQFKRKFCLTRHKRVHQNCKSYNCNVCGLGFDLVNQLKRHMRNIHMYNKENLRRSSRTNQKMEKSLNGTPQCLGSLEYSWPSLNSLPIYSTCIQTTSSLDTQQVQSKPTNFTPYSYPPGLIVSQSGKNPVSTALTNTFTPPSLPSHYQVRQLFNSIIPGSEGAFPYSNSMYFVHNYPPILPATNQNIYSPSVSNTKVHTATSISGVSNTGLQRMPLYGFATNMLNSPSLKTLPLTSRNLPGNTPAKDSLSVEKPTLPKT